MPIQLYEDNAGTLLFVDGDVAHDVTGAQFDSCFRADAKGWEEGFWGAGEPGPAYDRTGKNTFQQREQSTILLDLSQWDHIATYEDGEVKSYTEGGLAAQNYLNEENIAEGVADFL